MHAIVIENPGEPDVLRWNDVPDPVAGPGEVLLDVVAAGVNRADIVQRKGFYPPPPGAPEYPGLEASGPHRRPRRGRRPAGSVGDEVCALLARRRIRRAGGRSRPGSSCPSARASSLVEAAGLPEVACTVWSNVFMLAGLREGETFLVHGGASGIGTMAIQLAKARGARVLCTAGSAGKARALPRARRRRRHQLPRPRISSEAAGAAST